jgi:hypothetical protein
MSESDQDEVRCAGDDSREVAASKAEHRAMNQPRASARARSPAAGRHASARRRRLTLKDKRGRCRPAERNLSQTTEMLYFATEGQKPAGAQSTNPRREST